MLHRIWVDEKKQYWMVQMVFGPQLSFGIHLDFQRKYIDIHFLWFCFSFGLNAPYSSWIDSQRWDSRGGLRDYYGDSN